MSHKCCSGESHDHGDLPTAKEIENRPQECERIVRRLLERIDAHVASLAKSDLSINWAEMQLVLLALDADAEGRDVNVHLDGGDEISAYVRRNLFDELVGEPSNIFYTTQVDAKTVRYEALPKDFWKECIALLRQRLTELRQKG
jgi:hypothetical protein